MKSWLPIASLLLTVKAQSQTAADTLRPDSVIVYGFAQNSTIRKASGAVAVLANRDWQRFSPASVLSAINTQAGVRMEERSPGSYRLAIRGSSVRSPFGVRNIRFYLGQVPFTDPGGNTYLNQLAPELFGQLETWRGPAGSQYGAGTGGVLLMAPSTLDSAHLSIQLQAGSYGLFQVAAKAQFNTGATHHQLLVSHQQADGYRQQSAMRREMLSWTATTRHHEKATLYSTILLGDLFYETPGGLTLQQYQKDPSQARPAAGAFPSAVDAKASIRQQMIWAALREEWKISNQWTLNASIYGAYSSIANPSIRNYEKRSEPHLGGRMVFDYSTTLGKGKLQWLTGMEYQQGNFRVNVYRNLGGEAGALTTADKVDPRILLAFSELKLAFEKGWSFSAGASITDNKVRITRTTETPEFRFTSNYRNEWSPRFTLAKNFRNLTAYVLAAKGFSPPTTSELLPSTSVINTSLQAEYGWNYEAGLKGSFLGSRLYADISFFHFRLTNAIVQRRDASGADYFENAGTATQKGIEASLRYAVIQNRHSTLRALLAYTHHPFTYDELKQGANDLSGKSLPGVPRNNLVAGLDYSLKRFSAILNWQYTDPIWLNDANSEKAAPYQLLSARLGYKLGMGKQQWEVFAGADNLFNQTYSLGNDINAAAGRYYNAAAPRNWFAGLRFSR
ncbi:TonB-dependent receptor [Flavihumibacter rivuli]|uniref:TonB-dependent receptor family protein n=1 Tax=Flavihumibacter rivuli TaxID=2838156 RepID=UPI001BDDEBD0|nr:TonB-dependent receptor [Flavihumibacter rivuli]ULQ56301.1 TonB-dependent receptor [Flavihumibacter rivuli]